MDPSNQTASTPTYYLDSTTLIALQLNEPFQPGQLHLPRFTNAPRTRPRLHSRTPPGKTAKHNETMEKWIQALSGGIVAKIHLDHHLDATSLSLGEAEFQIQRHLLNPPLNAGQLAKPELSNPIPNSHTDRKAENQPLPLCRPASG